jgi:hypothetical protein
MIVISTDPAAVQAYASIDGQLLPVEGGRFSVLQPGVFYVELPVGLIPQGAYPRILFDMRAQDQRTNSGNPWPFLTVEE